ncbi:hypothetical protein GCM10009554_43840 [Kribbella koreensis]|uniref:Uncharacterized protein n=2 Tax=Kribbella koreensis TaxID=57909 RepID=A0ABN1QTD5_9ACTN
MGLAVGGVSGLVLGSAVGIGYGAPAAYVIGTLASIVIAFGYAFGLLAGGAGIDAAVRKPRLMRGHFSFAALKLQLTPVDGLVLAGETVLLSYVVYRFLQPAFVAWMTLSTRQHATAVTLMATIPLLIAGQLWVVGHNAEVVDTDRSLEGHSPSTARRRPLGRQLRLSPIVVSVVIAPVALLEIVRFWLEWLPTDRSGARTRSLISAALPNVLAPAAGVWLVWMLGALGYLIQARLAAAALRRGGFIPDDFATSVHQAARLSLLQPYGGNDFAFCHSIVRERLASLAGNSSSANRPVIATDQPDPKPG